MFCQERLHCIRLAWNVGVRKQVCESYLNYADFPNNCTLSIILWNQHTANYGEWPFTLLKCHCSRCQNSSMPKTIFLSSEMIKGVTYLANRDNCLSKSVMSWVNLPQLLLSWHCAVDEHVWLAGVDNLQFPREARLHPHQFHWRCRQ